jgi:hypothetical protein
MRYAESAAGEGSGENGHQTLGERVTTEACAFPELLRLSAGMATLVQQRGCTCVHCSRQCQCEAVFGVPHPCPVDVSINVTSIYLASTRFEVLFNRAGYTA